MINMKKLLNLLTILFIILVFATIFAYFLTKYYSQKINPYIYSYAETMAKKISTDIINNSLTEELEKELSTENLYTIIKNEQEEIQMIDFNTSKVNVVLTNLTNNIEDNIKNMELIQENNKDYIITNQNHLIYNLPIGATTGNIFLSNLGTNIPLKLSLIADAITNLETDITEYGLNNALLKIEIKVLINTKITAPFTSKEITIENTIPVSIKVIQGLIPGYYINGIKQN